MSAQKGRDLLLKCDDGTGAFITVAGLRTQRVAFNADTVDITDFESTGRWRELLAGGGIKRASIAGTGVFKDSASDLAIRQKFFDGIIVQWQVIVPAFGTLQGPFQISSLDYRGDQLAELTFDVSLESAGQIVFTPLATS
jgi:TP901-1 family phage major tail protein